MWNPAQDGGKIGPEFTFGLTLDKSLEEPFLIIKTAWGGKSLYYDFPPPSAGTYPRTPADIEKGAQSGSGLRQVLSAHDGAREARARRTAAGMPCL